MSNELRQRLLNAVTPEGVIRVDLQDTSVNVEANITNTAIEVSNDAGNPVPVSGTFYQATQPVSGTVTATAQPGVDIGDVTINNASGASAVNIQDGGNTITVDGTVATSNMPSTVDTNSGNKSASTLRVVLATDQPSLTNALTVSQGTATNLKTQSETYMGGSAVGASNPMQIRPAHKNHYYFLIPSQVHVASANTVHWDMFNADAALIVRVVSIRQIPNITTAVTGIVFDWLLERTTAVGTGGSALTAWLADTSDTALDADITCRSKPSGGATQSTDLFNYSISSEETNAATIQLASQGGLELVPSPLTPWDSAKGIVLRQNQGLRCVQITNSNAGNTGWIIGFTVE